MSDTLVNPSVVVDEKGRPIKGVEVHDERAMSIQRRIMLVMTIVPLVGTVTAMVLLWGTGISSVDFSLFLGFYFFTGLGITVGYHRLFTHRSFAVPRPVRILIAVAGSMAVQGALVDWVATHRRHHAYSDELGDPHSPHLDAAEGFKGVMRGLYHAHMGWLFTADGTVSERWAPDLLEDRDIKWINDKFGLLVIISFVLPAVLGGLITMSISGAITAFIWGSLVRIFLLHHVTWSINSICHFYGTKPYDSRDESRNNWIMALLAFGEGWHNAHHAFPTSARHGLAWYEFDISWITIRSLQLTGLAKEIKLPAPHQLARRGAG